MSRVTHILTSLNALYDPILDMLYIEKPEGGMQE